MIENEKVLAVSREDLFGCDDHRIFHGFLDDRLFHREIFRLIGGHGKYLPDGEIENNPHWKQIIPYVLFQYKDKFFLYRRLKGEQRLVGKLSLGIGGHVELNGQSTETFDVKPAMIKEFFREVRYNPVRVMEPIFKGLINEENHPVSKSHIGLVFHVEGESDKVDILPDKDNEKIGFFTLPELQPKCGEMEPWSQILLEKVLPSLV